MKGDEWFLATRRLFVVLPIVVSSYFFHSL